MTSTDQMLLQINTLNKKAQTKEFTNSNALYQAHNAMGNLNALFKAPSGGPP
jgi:hypothetical protein